MNENQNSDTKTGPALTSHRMPYSLLNTCEATKVARLLILALKRTLRNWRKALVPRQDEPYPRSGPVDTASLNKSYWRSHVHAACLGDNQLSKRHQSDNLTPFSNGKHPAVTEPKSMYSWRTNSSHIGLKKKIKIKEGWAVHVPLRALRYNCYNANQQNANISLQLQ